DLIIKIKEPIRAEYYWLDLFEGKTLFTYLHLSGVEKSLTEKLMERNITGIAYETVEDEKGKLPLLAPMSDVAGVLAIQYGAQYLQKKYNGFGKTLGYIPNTDPAYTVIVGGGHVGKAALLTAAGMGAKVALITRSQSTVDRLKKEALELLGKHLYSNVQIFQSTPEILAEELKKADLVVGGVLVAGAKAPQVIKEEHVKSMKKGTVIVDVAIDQGGSVWGSKATTHENPIYEIEGKIFCCVANMPGQVSRQSTQALTSATLPYIQKIGKMGVMGALKADPGFMKGLNTYQGKITYEAVAKDLKMTSFFQQTSTMEVKIKNVVSKKNVGVHASA
ncbi:MAG: alanine dehydrogenase, partial [Candidatus Peregrinibacteria bacterium]